MQIIFYLRQYGLGIFFRIVQQIVLFSINVFKSQLNLNIIYDKSTFFFYVGSRLGQIFHARIHMGCSALNSDLFRKNIVNSQHCTCGAIETLTHYLLNCPNYNIPRQYHIQVFALNLPIPLSSELLLVGSNELTINQHRNLFVSAKVHFK